MSSVFSVPARVASFDPSRLSNSASASPTHFSMTRARQTPSSNPHVSFILRPHKRYALLRVYIRASIQAIFRRSMGGILHVNEQPVVMDDERCSECSNRDYTDVTSTRSSCRSPNRDLNSWWKDATQPLFSKHMLLNVEFCIVYLQRFKSLRCLSRDKISCNQDESFSLDPLDSPWKRRGSSQGV